MEQKQSDEIQESFLGEEFIDEEDVQSESRPSREFSSGEALARHKSKGTIKKKAAIRKPAKTSKAKSVEKKEPEIIITSAKPVPQKEPVSPSSPLGESRPPFDPWKAEGVESGFFKDASTWKAITAIMVILLVFSVFTQGFHFSGKTEGQKLSPAAAQEAALSFVNNNLLQPPFLAEASNVKEMDSLYKVTLEVAGQSVDSYLTDDGTLFFPQGFVVAEGLKSSGSESSQTSSEKDLAETVPTENTSVTEEGSETPAADLAPEEAPEGPASEEQQPLAGESGVAPSSEVQSLHLDAKKWFFAPRELTVSLGTPVELTIVPSGVSFTFSIPGLNVQQEVQGETKVQFTPETSGTYPFSCSSCEEWRGMTGTLVVR